MQHVQRLGVSLALLLTAIPSGAEKAGPAGVTSHSVTKDGVSLDISLTPLEPGGQGGLQAGDDVRIGITLRQGNGGTPLAGLRPAAWIDPVRGSGSRPSAENCVSQVRKYLEGSTFGHAEIDLTSHYVAVLNAGNSVAIFDPRFGYGDTQRLANIELPGEGEDWAIDARDDTIFVSVPSSHQVAVIDTANWEVRALVNVAGAPSRMVLQPDGAYLWVGVSDGVAAIRTSDLKVAARIVTGQGSHDLAISSDNAFVMVTNGDEGKVSLIDVRKLARVRDLPAGRNPAGVAYSALAKAFFVTSAPDGVITAIGGRNFDRVTGIPVERGVAHLKITPNGRYAVALNEGSDEFYAVDVSTNRMVSHARLEKRPNQIAFSNKLMFVRHAGSDTVLMIPLASLGQGSITAADFTGGNHAPGKMARMPKADGIVQASSEDAVLVANPGDHAVYFYMEGMAAPMGNFSTGTNEPRAVMVVERNLRERQPGYYETVARLTSAGKFDAVFFVDSPRVVQCVEFSVGSTADATTERTLPGVEAILPEHAETGKPVNVRIRLTSPGKAQGLSGLRDVVITLIGPGAVWQSRQLASDAGDGFYAAEFSPGIAGTYSVLVAAAAEGLDLRTAGTFRVGE